MEHMLNFKVRSQSTLALLGIVGLLSGCMHAPLVDWQHPSANYDSRVQFLVIHATEIDFNSSLRVLTHGDVSSHYLVDRDGKIYGLVPESQRAWHAGPSYWQGATPLNPSSIGIEIVSVPTGMPAETEVPFPEVQIRAVRTLVADVAHRNGILPDRIVGHGEVQPEGRTDPGRLFPWATLAEDGLVPVPAADVVGRFTAEFAHHLPDIRYAQERLATLGYRIRCTGLADQQTHEVLRVFQGRYRQTDVQGLWDAETAALLYALTTPAGRVLRDKEGHYQPFVASKNFGMSCEIPNSQQPD
jgi:N-acetylmuramoyl-L-alanine amidase